MNGISRGVLGVTVVGFLLAPVSAMAGAIYQGSDYSYTTDSNRKAVICDQESDGNGVHVDYNSTFQARAYRFDETGGAGSACDTSSQVLDLAAIWRHRTVEEQAWEPDAASDYHYH
jgi:hypothetical protein